jgi:hypothetical protein
VSGDSSSFDQRAGTTNDIARIYACDVSRLRNSPTRFRYFTTKTTDQQWLVRLLSLYKATIGKLRQSDTTTGLSRNRATYTRAPMDSTPTEHQTYLSQPTWSNRLVSFLLALATTVLIALLMLAMGAIMPGEDKKVAPLVSMQFSHDAANKPQQARAAAKHSPAPPRTQPPTPQKPVVKPPVPTSSLLNMSHQEFAAADISNLPKHSDQSSGDNTAGNSTSTYGPGDGPGGVHLFNAEWYREPTRAELATYLSQTNAQGEWATIACKTIEHYHVENCQELDESPPGSGLARALRQAAWQFLVRPPRVDGHVLIGSWVRIRFTFTKAVSSEPAASTMPGADDGR